MTTTALPAQTAAPTRRRFTVDEFYAMAEAGMQRTSVSNCAAHGSGSRHPMTFSSLRFTR